MNPGHDTFEILIRYIPVFLAILLWACFLFSKLSLSKLETMRQLKRWYDLPRSSATENKEETLNKMISARERQAALSFKTSVIFSGIAIFWLFYIPK